MLLLLVLQMLVVLVVLVIFVGRIFERVKTSKLFFEIILESKIEISCHKKIQKIPKTKSKIHLDFRVLQSIIPLRT